MLAEKLKIFLASTFSYYLKAHMFHWNVEGILFVQLHQLFGQIYEDSFDAIDTIAEEIRTLDAYAPGSFTRFQELSLVPEQSQIPRAKLMIEELLADTQTMIDLANEIFAVATDDNKQDIANFAAERLASHNKYSWQLKSLLKEGRG
jgi:starvation-inducible DNA-binding protein